jgi:hypothetical protein
MELAKAGENSCALRRIARKLIAMADGGDLHAIREIADRIEGKVPQAKIIQGDEEGGPVRHYAELPRKAGTATEWLEDVNARRDTVIEVIDVKPCHPETSGTH